MKYLKIPELIAALCFLLFLAMGYQSRISIDDVTKLNYEALSYEKDKNKFLVKLKVTGSKGTLDITRTIVVMDVNEKPVSKNQTFF